MAALHAVMTTDVRDGLIATDPDVAPTPLVRAAALAWAEAACGDLRSVEAKDNLTDLTTQAYLRTRLNEVYRQAARLGVPAASTHALLVVTLDLTAVSGWSRIMAMVLVSDALREIFDGGESLALLGPSVAAVLSERDPGFGDRALSAGWLITERLKIDRQLAPTGRPALRLERLPATHKEARDLLQSISRA
jgi:hypothetical protein